MDDIQKLLTDLAPLGVSYAVRAVGVLLILFIAWIVAGWISRMVARGLERGQVDLTLSKFAARVARWVVLLLAGLACLSVFGIQTTSFAAVLGAAGLAIGLAFQGTLSNIAAGVMLLIFRPFKVGDVVTAAGETGTVHEIELFTTTLDTADNRRFIIPNSSIFGTVIENVSHHDTRRVEVSVGVDYTADIDHTREVLLRAAFDVEGRIDDPEPAVVLNGLGGSSVDWAVRVWCPASEFFAVKQGLTRSVKLALDEAHIGIPYPTMDINLTRP